MIYKEYEKKFQEAGKIYPYYKTKTTDPNYKIKIEKYKQESRYIGEEFKKALFKEYGVENNPKREECYRLSYEYGHSSGFCEIENYFSDLVRLIK